MLVTGLKLGRICGEGRRDRSKEMDVDVITARTLHQRQIIAAEKGSKLLPFANIQSNRASARHQQKSLGHQRKPVFRLQEYELHRNEVNIGMTNIKEINILHE